MRGRGAGKHTKVKRKEKCTEKKTSIEHRHETGSGEVNRGSARSTG